MTAIYIQYLMNLKMIAVVAFSLFFFRRSEASTPSAGSSASFHPPVNPLVLRNDSKGLGHFGAPRGKRKHKGLDFVAQPGQSIFSPIDGIIQRRANPYANDSRFTGCLIIGTGRHVSYSVKLFYMQPVAIGISVSAGDYIGKGQEISKKWGKEMLDHLHMEVYYNSRLIDPTNLFHYQNS
ncbi:MAG: M23 family metallopeptidase [Bacteroidota bacterium]